ncbi:MAG: alkaline phosphatase family protein [Propionibacteriaceae bacterium]|nr:alkaline phosphatase family protein [Propionibacteriaceae bacterium]
MTPRPDRHVGPSIVIIADGWTRGPFLELLENGDLPEIASFLVAEGGLARNVVSNLPSISIASHTTLLTGTDQEAHGIPGHRWHGACDHKITNYLSLRGPSAVNRDISPSVSTLFEVTRDPAKIAVQSIVNRGATVTERLLTQRPAPILERAAELIRNNPQSTSVVWLPRVDSLGHIHGPLSPTVYEEMRATSRALGTFATQLHKDGLYDGARITLVPDHGQRTIVERARLDDLLKGAGLDCKINPRRGGGNRSIILTGGDASAQVYMGGGVHADLRELASKLVATAEVELCCWKSGELWAFMGADGVATASVVQSRGQESVAYRVTEGNDPLGLSPTHEPIEIDTTQPSVTLGKYPDFLHQIMHSYVDGRSGQLYVFPSSGFHFGVGPRVGWRLGFHKGSHGGPLREEVLVTAAYKGDVTIDGPVRSSQLLRRLGYLSLSHESGGVVAHNSV